jgi:hypothetical protein
MRIFSPPYRWASRPFANIGWCFWDIVHGVKRLWLWKDIVWNDYDWDWEPLAKVIAFKLRRMEPVMRNGIHVNGERHAREIAICYTLLERLMRDEYLDDVVRHAGIPWPLDLHTALTDDERRRFSVAVKKADEQAKADLELFGKMLTRHLRSWWD